LNLVFGLNEVGVINSFGGKKLRLSFLGLNKGVED